MTLPVRGHGLSFGIGDESVYGTPVARTNWLRGSSSTMERRRMREPMPHQGSYGQASTMRRFNFVTAEEVGGTIEWPMAYNDSTLLLLSHVFGAAPTDAGANPYTHTYALASPPPVGFTLEVIKGTHASLNTAQVFTSCKVNQFTMTAEVGRPVMCSADIIAQTAGGIVAAGSPSYSSSPFPILHNHLDSTIGITWDSVVHDARRLVLTVNRNLSRNQQLGSLYTGEPFENRLEVGLEFEVLWNNAKPYTGAYADTQADATFTFSSAPRIAAFTLHNCVVDEVSTPTPSAEGIVQTVRMTAYADATDQGLGLVITNANALYTAN